MNDIESISNRIAELRSGLDECTREQRRKEGQHAPLAEQMAPAVKFVQTPRIPVGSVLYAIRHEDSLFPGAAHLRPVSDFLCWLFGDEIKTKIEADLKKEIGKTPTLSAAEKAKTLAEIREKRRRLEVEEETLCRQLEEAGLDITRRGDLSPEIYLGLNE
jgi:hypothetical protein